MLSEEVLSLIESIDRPTMEYPRPGVALIRNRGESDITGFQIEGKAYFFKRFRTFDSNTPFLLDSTTGKVSQISELEWQVVDQLPLYQESDLVERLSLTTSESEVRAAVQRLWSLLHPIARERFELAPVPDYSDALDLQLVRTLLINTTEQCNIRCTYCYYGGNYESTRVHNSTRLSQDVAKDAVDRFLENHHLVANSRRAIYFFGGEPLLNFELIKQVVLYVKDVAAKRQLDISNVIFQVATNAMLLDQTIADFVAEHGIHINVSIDGPNHDRYRIDARGAGTLNRVLERVEWLWRYNREYFINHVGINCVVTPPYDLSSLYNFFIDWEPSHDLLHLDLDLVLPGGDDVNPFADIKNLEQAKQEAWKIFIKTHSLNDEQRERSWHYFFSTGFNFLHKSFWRVVWRSRSPIENGQIENINGLNSLPGLFINTVRTDGTYYASYEYQSEAFRIGSIYDGFDKEKIYNVIHNFRSANAAGACGTCWAARLCQVDYPDFYVSDLDTPDTVATKLAQKEIRCAAERFDLASALGAVETIKQRYGTRSLQYVVSEREDLMKSGEQLGWLPVVQDTDNAQELRHKLGQAALGSKQDSHLR